MAPRSITTLLEMGLMCLAPLLLGSNGGGCSSDDTPFASGVDSGVDSVEDAPGSGDAAVVGLADAAVEDAPDVSCTVTISGGLSASQPCTGTLFRHFIQMNTSFVNFGFEGGGVTISVGIIFNGDFRVGTYTVTDDGMSGGIQVDRSFPPPLEQWVAEAAELGHGVFGTFTLNITSATELSFGNNYVDYVVHGTMTGALPTFSPPDPHNPPPDISFFGEF
jgi:hypothetical protein